MATANVQTIEDIRKQFDDFPFVYSDGEPMDSPWHRDCMNLLIASVLRGLRHREDFYVGGDMFIYFSPQRVMNKDFRGPDFFVVNGGVSLTPDRLCWVSWIEDSRLPDVVIELTSPTTEQIDRTTKFQLYEQTWRTHNYFIYDPATQKVDGWELDRNHHYQPLTPNEHGRLWCAELCMWVGVWKGEYQRHQNTYLRFFDEQGDLVLSFDEAAQQRLEEAERAQETAERAQETAERAQETAERLARDEKRRATAAERSAEEQKRCADEAQRLAKEEKRRADAAESELARLRKLLNDSGRGNGTSPPTP